MEKHYTIGLDYGSLSGRGVLVDTEDGHIIHEEELKYAHGVLDTCLPDGTPLNPGWALQHPQDFLEVLYYVVPRLVKESGVSPRQVVGIGIDFTSSTVIPLDKDFKPLCHNTAFSSHPHAWPKMWKHHAAQSQADKLNIIAAQQGRPYLSWYGGAISSECLIPKVIQVFDEDKQVFYAADCFVEAADYLTSLLAGRPVFSSSIAVARAMRDNQKGYPDKAFLGAVEAGLEELPKDKLAEHFPNHAFGYPGEKIGTLCYNMAQRLGLSEGTAISPPQMDAYAAMPGIGICEAGTAMMILGTSTGIMLLNKERKEVPGVTACLPDTYYPGLYGYASGQPSVGDCFQWFVDNCVPEAYAIEARKRNMNLHGYLTELASKIAPGETGLVALDWFNGNKSCLANSKLSGLILGLNLKTRPEHIYRSLQEATAFGARVIIENYEKSGVAVNKIAACGGITGKNLKLMQIYADVIGKPLYASSCTQGPALGSAIYAASAARDATGYKDIYEAVQSMGWKEYKLYLPDMQMHVKYDRLFKEYLSLYEYFGRDKRSIMESLTELRRV